MSLLSKVGLLLILIAIFTALYSSNLFGYSKKIGERIALLETKEKDDRLSKSEYEELRYFKINRFFTLLWKPILSIGFLLFVIGLFA